MRSPQRKLIGTEPWKRKKRRVSANAVVSKKNFSVASPSAARPSFHEGRSLEGVP